MTGGSERREHERVHTPTISVVIDDEDRFRRRYMQDLSEGGMYVLSRKVYPIGSVLSLYVVPPNWPEAIQLDGEVVRVDWIDEADREEGDDERAGVGLGVRFVDLTDEQRGAIAALLGAFKDTEPDPQEEAAAQPPPEQESASEMNALRARLAESEAQARSLHEELERYEQYDEANRALVKKFLENRENLEGELTQQLTMERERNADLVLKLSEAQQTMSALTMRVQTLTRERDEAIRLSDSAAVQLELAGAKEAELTERLGDVDNLQSLVEALRADVEEHERMSKLQEDRAEYLQDRLNQTSRRYRDMQAREDEVRRVIQKASLLISTKKKRKRG